MLANRMTDDSSENKDIPVDQTSEPHVVVGCPSCKTKFAVEGSLIASYEVPKFHCSRCDLVFQLTPATRDTHVTQQTPHNPKRWVLADGAEHQASNPFRQPTTPSSALKPSDFTLGEAASRQSIETHQPLAPLEERAGLSLLGLRPSAGPALSSAFTRQEALTQSSPSPAQLSDQTSPTVEQPSDKQSDLDPFSLFDAPSSRSQSTTAPSKPLESTGNPSTPESVRPTVSAPITPPAAQARTQSKTELRTEPVDTKQPSEGSTKRQRIAQAFQSMLSKLSERNQSLVHLSMPILGLFAFFCVMSYAGTLMPQTIDSIFRRTVPSILTGKVAQLPPSTLLVQEVSLELEKTQSKEIIPVVRGVIHNAGNSKIEDVLIETLGFDARGEVVVRAQAPLRSALAREKISDLPLTTVKKFQTSLSGRNSTIDSDERVAFSVALLSDATIPPQVSYFSARVFSVGTIR
jgi:hypothetical protein